MFVYGWRTALLAVLVFGLLVLGIIALAVEYWYVTAAAVAVTGGAIWAFARKRR